MSSQSSDRADQAYFDSPDFDPNRFLASLVPDPHPPADVPVPPRLREGEEVPVRRTYKLPVEVDADLQAAAAARHITVEELLREWTRDHHAA
jgi:hypothetical protein